MKKFWKISLCFILLICCCVEKSIDSIVNLNHLNHLTETVKLDNELCSIIHIYAEYPQYKWVDASQEGIACVDDVARAVVVYLRYYEITGIDSMLNRAKELLNFILYMQTEDGEFYNFIDSERKINKTGTTSRKSFGFCAARGYWALGFGFRMFKSKDPIYASKLKKAFLKCKLPIKNILQFYQYYEEINNRKYPQWLIHKIGADATSVLLLGLAEYLKTEQDCELQKYAIYLAEGIMQMQVESDNKYEGAFLSWGDIWHAWGNAQTQALASLGHVLKQNNLIQAAMREADNFYAYLLTNKMLRQWQFNNENSVIEFPQLSYDIRCMAVGLLRLYEATSNDDYAILAGLTASWLMGNNASKMQIYNPLTGRCFDGVIDSSTINLNSGAESTIEALYTMIEISNNPVANKYLNFIANQKDSLIDNSNRIIYYYKNFEDKNGKSIILIKDLVKGKFLLMNKKSFDNFKHNMKDIL